MADKPVNILIAGGGTGGHLFPGIAIAQTFLERDPETGILFVGTDRPFEKNILSRTGFDHKSVNTSGLKGMGLWAKLKSAMKIPGAVFQAALMILRFKPSVIIGVGGYSSGPVALAAWFLRKKVTLHEQNSLAGITNKILARFADRIYVSFPDSISDFPERKVLVTGNPVRKEILELNENRNRPDEKPFTVLVAGGSQGAHSINMAVCDALKHLDSNDTFCFIHQSGEQDELVVRNQYESSGFEFTVKPFFSDMHLQYARADLIICRAGATTIAEITAIGHSAILIPYPHAADNHQETNALSLVTIGAAEMITEDLLTGSRLAEKIKLYRENRGLLSSLSEKSKAWGKPDAAAVIVDDCYRLIGIPENQKGL